MNTKMKIAAGMLAGLVAGTMLVGTAVAAPRMMSSPAYNGYGMMGSSDASGTFERPSAAERNSFMDRYRTDKGTIDFDRMHSDVTSGKVSAPCANGSDGTTGTPGARQPGQSEPRRGSMMGDWTPNGDSGGYGMMGSIY